MKKLIVILIMFVMYVMYYCSSASSQEIENDTIYLNKTINNTIVDNSVSDSLLQEKTKKQFKKLENKEIIDSTNIIRLIKQEVIYKSLDSTTKILEKQNYKMDSLINIVKKKK